MDHLQLATEKSACIKVPKPKGMQKPEAGILACSLSKRVHLYFCT